jgi:hypothetical protein
MRIVAMIFCASWMILLAPEISVASEVLYSMEDLQALAEQESWVELLDHFADIKPTQRKAKWKKLLEKASLEHLEYLKKQNLGYETLTFLTDLMRRYPPVKKSKLVVDKRAEIFLQSLQECYANRRFSELCTKEVERFLNEIPNTADVVFEVARLVRRHRLSFSLRLFVQAVEQGKKAAKKKKWCQDSELAYAVESGLGDSPKNESTQKALRLAFGTCWQELRDRVMEKFFTETSSYRDKNICPELKKKKMLKKFSAAYCEDHI